MMKIIVKLFKTREVGWVEMGALKAACAFLCLVIGILFADFIQPLIPALVVSGIFIGAVLGYLWIKAKPGAKLYAPREVSWQYIGMVKAAVICFYLAIGAAFPGFLSPFTLVFLILGIIFSVIIIYLWLKD